MKFVLIIVLNGWIIPLFISLFSVISFLKLEVSPVIYGNDKVLSSFPYLQLAEQSLYVFIIWALLSVVFKASKSKSS
jgi:hypothetical protein